MGSELESSLMNIVYFFGIGITPLDERDAIAIAF